MITHSSPQMLTWLESESLRIIAARLSEVTSYVHPPANEHSRPDVLSETEKVFSNSVSWSEKNSA
jgi:hypothetical protein